MRENVERTNVLGVGVSAINMDEAVQLLLDARRCKDTGYVCVTGVHGVIESQRDQELKSIHNRSFLTVPDGMPTVWMGREQGFVHMGRVYGPDLMLHLCEATASIDGCALTGDKRPMEAGGSACQLPQQQSFNHSSTGCDSNYLYPSQDETGSLDLGGARTPIEPDRKPIPADETSSNHQRSTEKIRFTHFLYGSTPEVLEKLKNNLEQKFPGLRIVGVYSPPFRPLNIGEETELQRIVAECKPDFLWVGLSTPKQEKFMAAHAPSVQGDPVDSGLAAVEKDSPSTERYPLECGIMLGVGAAFDIHAGLLKDAPEWIKNSGLQWFYRLCQEPRRLWRRYMDIVPRFLWLAFLQLLGIKTYDLSDRNQPLEEGGAR